VFDDKLVRRKIRHGSKVANLQESSASGTDCEADGVAHDNVTNHSYTINMFFIGRPTRANL
jgi:hypothetical protein